MIDFGLHFENQLIFFLNHLNVIFQSGVNILKLVIPFFQNQILLKFLVPWHYLKLGLEVKDF